MGKNSLFMKVCYSGTDFYYSGVPDFNLNAIKLIVEDSLEFGNPYRNNSIQVDFLSELPSEVSFEKTSSFKELLERELPNFNLKLKLTQDNVSNAKKLLEML